jgi:ABC-2 type transport system ATP-binding protein
MDYRDKRISFEFGGKADDLSELVRELVIKEIPVLWCREVDVNLEEAFMTITKGEVS